MAFCVFISFPSGRPRLSPAVAGAGVLGARRQCCRWSTHAIRVGWLYWIVAREAFLVALGSARPARLLERAGKPSPSLGLGAHVCASVLHMARV